MTVQDYLDQVIEQRQPSFNKLRKVIKTNLPPGFEERIQYNMISYVVPHELYLPGYHVNPEDPLAFMSIASQKSHIALYHSGIYMDQDLHDWFVAEYPKYVSTKLNMGKSCIRFKNPQIIPFELISKLVSKLSVKAYIDLYESIKP